MKGRNLLLMAIISLAIGVLMIIFRHTLASNGIVVGCGILFILAGVCNITFFLGARDKSGRARVGAVGTTIGWLASAAAVVLGVIMVLFRAVFETMVGYMFGILLVFGALFQFFLLIFGSKPVRLSPWFFLVPTVLVGVAVYIFLQQPGQSDYLVMRATGWGLAFFGFMTLVEALCISVGNRTLARAKKEAAKETPAEVAAPAAGAPVHHGAESTESHAGPAEGHTDTPAHD